MLLPLIWKEIIWNNIWYSFKTNLIENVLLILKNGGNVYRKDGQSDARENGLKTKLADSCDLKLRTRQIQHWSGS